MFVTHDPQFKILGQKFPKYEENGQVQARRIGKRVVFEASMLVRIPTFDQKLTDAEVGLHLRRREPATASRETPTEQVEEPTASPVPRQDLMEID